MTRVRMNKEERKKQIIAVSKKVFLEKGFRNTIMDDIMQAAQLSRGGLYHHYESTGEILYDIMVEGNRERERVIKKTIEFKSDLSHSEIIAETVVDKILDENEFISIYAMFLQEINRNKKIESLYKKLKEKSTNNILALFGFTGENKNLAASFDLITNLINSMILGGEILQLRDNFRDNRDVIKKMILVILENKAE